MYRQLRTVLKAYRNGEREHYTRGDWSIATGGYDLWFEIYYKGIPKVQCIDGELEVGNDDNINVNKVLLIIKQELPYLK